MRWKNYARILLCGFALSCNALPALANFTITQGSGLAIFSIDSGTTPAGTGNCAAATTECTASIPIDKSGTPLFATGNAGLVTGTGGTFPATQSGSWTATVTQATGTNLHMVCDSGCSGSGGTSSNFGSAFPSAGTAIGLTNGTNMVAWSATSNYGTAPSAIAVPAVNAYVTNGTTAIGNNADGVTVSTGGNSPVIAYLESYNGTSFDRVKSTSGALWALLQAGSAIVGKVGVDQTTFGTTNGVVSAAVNYQAVAASQTATVLQTSTGATGDYLSHCTIYPASTSPGAVTVFDSTNTAANSAVLFAGGASSASNLVPFAVPVGAKSVNGAWKVTTGASVSVVCEGKFS